MTAPVLDPGFDPPPGLSEQGAQREAILYLSLEIADRPRRDVFRLAQPFPTSLELSYLGGLSHAGIPTCAWLFTDRPTTLPSGALLEVEHFVVGAARPACRYYSVYPSNNQEGELEGLIAADSEAFSERERILDIYRERLRERPADTRRQYELALLGLALVTGTLFRTADAILTYPGPLDEFLPVALAACEAAPREARYLAVAAGLHERRLDFAAAARLYGEAAALDRGSETYAFLHADALVFAGDLPGARTAAAEADRRARARRSGQELGLHRQTLIGNFRMELQQEGWELRRGVEGLEDGGAGEAEEAEEQRRTIRIDPGRVPVAFRDLIPLARKWGLSDDAARGYFVDRASAEEKQELRRILRGRVQAVTDWIDSFMPGDMSDEAGCFMYMLEAHEEMGP